MIFIINHPKTWLRCQQSDLHKMAAYKNVSNSDDKYYSTFYLVQGITLRAALVVTSTIMWHTTDLKSTHNNKIWVGNISHLASILS